MQKVKDLRDKLEGTQDTANDEVDNLKYLLNVDTEKKETLQNRVEMLHNIVVGLEHDCAE